MRYHLRPARAGAWLLAAALLLFSIPAAAQPNGLRLEITPFGGAVVQDQASPVEDDVLVGGRLGLWLTGRLGIEGSVHYSPTHTRTLPRQDVRLYAFSGDVVLNLLPPDSRLVPYLTGGWARTSFDAEDGGTTHLDGFDFGGGAKLRVYESATSRVSLRLDVRDVVAPDAEDVGSTESPLHNIFVSAGLGLAFGPSSLRDADSDGVLDEDDACPATPLGARVDAEGCPLDGDGDGVFDGLDHCAGTPAGATVDAEGCPSDSDGDGIYDGLDRCPGTVARARVDKDGCAVDGDGDGVPDGRDDCANTPSGAEVDEAGCPLDEDLDGVPDGIDRCPETPARADVDRYGCPLTRQEKEFLDTGTLRLENITFNSNSATLRAESYQALDGVGRMLERWPELRIEIGGHTDSRGPAEYNMELSGERAQSVLDYLLRNFNINSSQFTVMGYGETRPIADNDTADGRRANRRVEFRILSRGTIEREVEKP